VAHRKDTPDTPNTLAEPDTIRTQLRIPRNLWDQIKIEAIRESTTAEALTAKAFELYLASKEPGRTRKKSAA